MRPAVDAAFKVAIRVGLLALALQTISAAQQPGRLDSPNASSTIAVRLAQTGEFAGGSWTRLRGERGVLPDEPMRAFHLPGHPLFLAGALRVLPAPAMTYLHVPVTAALIAVIALLATLIGGARCGVIAGLIACLHPFMLAHGPVHDDIFLGTALDLWLLASCALWLERPPRGAARVGWLALIGLCAAWSCLVRSQSQALIVVLSTLPWLIAAFRPLRAALLVALACAVLAVGAWGARNQSALGSFFIGSTHDGITLWESNYPHAWEAVRKGQVEALNEKYMQSDFAANATASELEANRYFAGRAKEHILAHPVDTVVLGVQKVLVTLLGLAPQLPWLHRSNVFRALGSLLPLLIALYALRFVKPRELSAAQRFIAIAATIVVLGTLAMGIIGPIGVRYRFPAEWLTWIGVAFAIDRALTRWSRWKPARASA
jgi:hypothetical protein